MVRAQEGDGEGGTAEGRGRRARRPLPRGGRGLHPEPGRLDLAAAAPARIGYGRAARIIDQLHYAGILGPPDGSKPREVLVGFDQLDEYCRARRQRGHTRRHRHGETRWHFPPPVARSCSPSPSLLSLSPLRLPLPIPPAERLVGAMLGNHPARPPTWRRSPTASADDPPAPPANQQAFEWAAARFREAGITARKEPFRMPGLWLERSATATVRGEECSFSPRRGRPAVLHADAQGRPHRSPGGRRAGGAEADFARLGTAAKGAIVLVETDELQDLDGLFREYNEAAASSARAIAAGVAGLVYMSSRPNDLLARHNASLGLTNRHPMMMMERDGAARALRLIRTGTPLTLTAVLDIQRGPAYQTFNVIGEIRGASRPDEIVLIGAHLDSWDLGTGALDNGANAMMVLDIARQIRRLGLTPARTIRFALWNGEEQNLNGSLWLHLAHAAELDHHVMASSYDIGTGGSRDTSPAGGRQ